MGMGLGVNPRFMPDATELATLRPSFLRSLVYEIGTEVMPADLDILTDTNYPVLLTLNNECAEVGGDWSGWADAVKQVAELAQGRVYGLCVGNEFDSWWVHNNNDVPPDFAAQLIRTASGILKPYGIKTIATSVVSDQWGDYLQRMMDLCRDAVDYADLHAYGQIPDGWQSESGSEGFGLMGAALRLAQQIAGRPVIMSEIGITIANAGSEASVSSYMSATAATVSRLGRGVCPFASWFAWRDEIGKPEEHGVNGFGLRTTYDAGDVKREAWDMFRTLNMGDDTVPEEPTTPIIQAFRHIWQAANPSLPYDDQIAGFGLPTYWRQHLDEMGSPLSAEIDGGDGTVLQAFTRGVWRWTGVGVEKVN